MGETDAADEIDVEALLAAPAAVVGATGRRIRRSYLLAGICAAVGVGLLVLGVGTLWVEHSFAQLADTGVRTPATVTDVASHVVSRERNLVGSVTVTYAVGSEDRTTVFDVNNHVTRYHVDDQVEVAYDPGEPSRVSLVGEPEATRGVVPWPISLAFGLLGLVMAAVTIAHLRRITRIVAAHEWLAVAAVRKPLPTGWRSGAGTVVQLGPETSPERVVACSLGFRGLPANIEPTAWIAGWGERQFVMAPPGGQPLLLMRRITDAGLDADGDHP